MCPLIDPLHEQLCGKINTLRKENEAQNTELENAHANLDTAARTIEALQEQVIELGKRGLETTEIAEEYMQKFKQAESDKEAMQRVVEELEEEAVRQRKISDAAYNGMVKRAEQAEADNLQLRHDVLMQQDVVKQVTRLKENVIADKEALQEKVKDNHDRAEEIIAGRENTIKHVHSQLKEAESKVRALELEFIFNGIARDDASCADITRIIKARERKVEAIVVVETQALQEKVASMEAVVEAAIEWVKCNIGEREFEDELKLNKAVKQYLKALKEVEG